LNHKNDYYDGGNIMSKNIGDYSFRNCDFLATDRLHPTLNAIANSSCEISDDWEIVLPVTRSRLAKFYSHDLFSFLADAFGICLRVRFSENIADELQDPKCKILLLPNEDNTNISISSNQSGAFYIVAERDSIIIVGKTERGCAQGVYHLEDEMRLCGTASVPLENTEHAPLFSPRMTHSGFELDTFSDEFLSAAAHAGMDSIMVFTRHPDMNIHGFEDPDALWGGTGRGYCDFNHLVWRAEGYGLDVYLYSHIKCDVYPDDEGAEAYYEAAFGTFFKKCPAIKGIIFVGECFEFPSKDPNTCGIRCQLRPAGDKRPSPGFYPSSDYPKMIEIVKKTIRAYNPTADIVFWTYNWGWAPKDARLSLIRSLPRDISLLVTFEMWEYLKDSRGETYRIADYSISFPGPSQVFVDEAEAAKDCGIRLYAMSNTGGRTWDMGSAPYLPVPQKWQKRYDQLRLSREKYGLCGLMENHHYGWMPSFIDLFAKNAFSTNSTADGELLEKIAKRDWGDSYKSALDAWQEFSNGMAQVVAADVDQYGPYRCGPAYPLLFTQTQKELTFPSVPWANHPGFGIWRPIYAGKVFPNADDTLMRLRHVSDVYSCFERGVEILKSAADEKSESQAEQIGVADYIRCCYKTAMHVMQWHIAKHLLLTPESDKPQDTVNKLLSALSLPSCDKRTLANYMHALADRETDNVIHALNLQKQDSRLGFEASMEYVFNGEVAEWKNSTTAWSLELLDEEIDKQ